MWSRSGNFESLISSGGELNRKVEYKNRSEDSIIKKLILCGYSNGTYQIIVKSSSGEKDTLLKSGLITAGFPESVCSDSLMKIYSSSCTTLTVVSAFLRAIKNIEISFFEIEQEISNVLSIDLSQDVRLPEWIKTGNFQSISTGSSSTLYRSIAYTKSNPISSNSIISTIELTGYNADDYQFILIIRAADREKYAELMPFIIAAGFPEPLNRDNNNYRLRFDASSRDRFNVLINSISTICDITEIVDDIHANVDFAIRELDYAIRENANQNINDIDSTDLDEDFLNALVDRDDDLDDLIDLNRNMLELESDERMLSVYTLDIDGDASLSSSLTNINTQDISSSGTVRPPEIIPYRAFPRRIAFPRPAFPSVIPILSYSPYISHNLFQPAEYSPQQDDFSNTVTTSMNIERDPSTTLPDKGENAKTLDKLGYVEEIPEEYTCALTNEIMTDPVYDPNDPSMRFERAVISRSLESKKENPFTRKPLTENQLVSDLELKEAIDNFASSLSSPLSPSLPSLK